MLSKDKNSNVNCIKFIAAILVILSHSYPLTGNGNDFIVKMTGGKLGLGSIAVAVFFLFSGFYLSHSLQKDDRTAIYLIKRVRKIFPPLIIVVLLSVFLLGPIFTELTLKEYFCSAGTYLYFLNGVLIPVHNLPGVFADAPYNPTVNGALWTLPVEFGCYIFLLFVVKMKKHWNKKYVNFFLLGIMFIVCPLVGIFLRGTNISILAAAISPFRMFCMGHLYSEIQDKLICDWKRQIILLIVLMISLPFFFFETVFALIFPMLIISVANSDKQWIKHGRWEQLSYEIYLCGFPIGQIIVAVLPDIGVGLHFVCNVLIAVFAAVFLHKIHECCKKITNHKKLLGYK